MSTRSFLKVALAVAITIGLSSTKADAKDFIQASAAIQIASDVSEGKCSIPEIVKIAKKSGMRIVILADRDLMRWEYGLWPLRNIIKQKKEANSIFRYGVKRYLKEIAEARLEYPDTVIIPGVESAPYYHWEGIPFTKSFALKDWHRHILAIGLESAKDFRKLPILGNPRGLLLPFNIKNIIYLCLPVIILACGAWCFYLKERVYMDAAGKWWGGYSRPWRIAGICLVIIGLAVFMNNYPFRDYRFNQYGKDCGIAPYQGFINYAREHGAMTFWAHPEAKNIDRAYGVDIETKEYADYILKSRDYTGFVIFHDGYEKVGRPGGIWDALLNEYCQGTRTSPAWAMGGLAVEHGDDLGAAINDLRTVFLVKRLTKDEVMGAMRSGRMYVARGAASPQFVLDAFTVKDVSSGLEKTMGQEVGSSGDVELAIRGHFLDARIEPCTILVIKNGVVDKTIEVGAAFDVAYSDAIGGNAKKGYYRIEIRSKGLVVVTNPVFVRKL